MNANKATHAGSCQACGRIQKLPGGSLSKHGYTRRWGFFEGECPGTDHQPYEQSCALIQHFIKNAEQQRDAIEAKARELAQPVTQPKAWLSEYVLATWQNRFSSYKSRQVTLFDSNEQHSNIFWFSLKGERVNAFTHSLYGNTAFEVANEMNRRFIENTLTPRIKQLNDYIHWQQKRVDDWKLAPLRDLKEVR
jgi:hypothetical protein